MTERKMIKITWLPRPRADVDEHSHIREECFEFEVPEEFIYSISNDKRLKISDDLELGYTFEYICRHCGMPLSHVASGSMGAVLECNCGTWTGDCSPFSGSWYGGKVTYQKFTEEEKKRKMEEEIRIIKAGYGVKEE